MRGTSLKPAPRHGTDMGRLQSNAVEECSPGKIVLGIMILVSKGRPIML